MLYEILQYLGVLNYDSGKLIDKTMRGEFKIEDGTMDLPLMTGQAYVIEGSIMNDGLHYYPTFDLIEETFDGRIVALRIPRELQNIANEISDYNSKNPQSGFTSESFGGYSYQRASNNGKPIDAIHVYADRLKGWRML